MGPPSTSLFVKWKTVSTKEQATPAKFFSNISKVTEPQGDMSVLPTPTDPIPSTSQPKRSKYKRKRTHDQLIQVVQDPKPQPPKKVRLEKRVSA